MVPSLAQDLGNGLAALSSDALGVGQAAQACEGSSSDVDGVVGTQALGADVLDAGALEHGTDGAAGQNAGTGGSGTHQDAACTVLADDLVRNGGTLQADLAHVLLGSALTLADSLGNLAGLADAVADVALAVAHDDQSMFGNPDGGEAVMKEAAQIAQAEEFIEAKSEKYHSHIAQGGSNVSGGQKQRLSIARAIAKRPELFIFDDSFSALDYKTDVALRKALKKKTAQSTVLIVAQRISTILHAEQIIVLDEGKIAGIGTHRELLDSCEVYRQIAASQLSEEELDLNGKGAEANA